MKLLVPACVALGLVFALAASPARAGECEDILAALSKRSDDLSKKEAKGAALCAGMGQLLGLIHAGGIVAEVCGNEAGAKDMKESAKAMEEGIGAECK
jgi:hypothetical protein